jgi:hypothetical protein
VEAGEIIIKDDPVEHLKTSGSTTGINNQFRRR